MSQHTDGSAGIPACYPPTIAHAQRWVRERYAIPLNGLGVALTAAIEETTAAGWIVAVDICGPFVCKVLIGLDGTARAAPRGVDQS